MRVHWIIALALTLGIAAAAMGASDWDQYKAVVAKVSPSIVSVRIVTKTEMTLAGQSQTSESRTTSQGVVVSADGLIMISNLPFATDRLNKLFQTAGSQAKDVGIKITPVSFQVRVDGIDQDFDGFLAATDKNLGLAFVKLTDPGSHTLTPIDFTSPASPEIGEPVIQITRLSKAYVYAPYFQTGRVSGQITKPRAAWILDGGVDDIGLPVYTQDGNIIGVLTSVPSGDEDSQTDEGGDDMGMMLRMVDGGSPKVATTTFLVPAAGVTSVVEMAKQQAATLAAARAKAATAAPNKTKAGAATPGATKP